MDSRAIVIAYECSPKKERQFFRELCSVLDHGSRIQLVPLSSLPPASRFDAILHKRTDDMVAALSGDEDAAARVRALENRLNDPNILPIDSLPGVRALLDRRSMALAIDSVIRSAPPALQNRVRRLAWTTVHASSPNLLGHIYQAGLDYPVIVKRMLACGSRVNHEMVIAYDDTGLLAAANGVFRGARLFVQEYVTSHGGALYKVYAIGRNVIVQTRAGLPATAKGDHPTTGYYYFDSQSLTTKTPKKPPSNSKAQAPEEIVSREIVRVLAEKLGLSLLGVDLLHDGATGKHVVVDVNYFPGYKGVKHAHKWLLEHLEELVEGHRLGKGKILAARTQHLRKVAEKEACTSRAALEASKVLPGTNV